MTLSRKELQAASRHYSPEGYQERRLRARAKTRELRLTKCRFSEPRIAGTYGLVDVHTNRWVFCDTGTGWGCTLDEVEEYLGKAVG